MADQPETLSEKPTDNKPIGDHALDQILREARTYNDFSEEPVSDAMIKALYELTKWGATSANSSPARFVFITSKEAKERLAPHLTDQNRAKTMKCPLNVIIAHDMEFYEKLPQLFPHTDAKSWFEGDAAKIEETAFRNGTLQGAYLMIAARALGLDCGPMSGFDKAGVDEEFFKGTPLKSNWLCNIGYGTTKNLFPRSPRLAFDEACEIL